jgi:hypothetical protein
VGREGSGVAAGSRAFAPAHMQPGCSPGAVQAPTCASICCKQRSASSQWPPAQICKSSGDAGVMRVLGTSKAVAHEAPAALRAARPRSTSGQTPGGRTVAARRNEAVVGDHVGAAPLLVHALEQLQRQVGAARLLGSAAGGGREGGATVDVRRDAAKRRTGASQPGEWGLHPLPGARGLPLPLPPPLAAEAPAPHLMRLL